MIPFPGWAGPGGVLADPPPALGGGRLGWPANVGMAAVRPRENVARGGTLAGGRRSADAAGKSCAGAGRREGPGPAARHLPATRSGHSFKRSVRAGDVFGQAIRSGQAMCSGHPFRPPVQAARAAEVAVAAPGAGFAAALAAAATAGTGPGPPGPWQGNGAR